MHRRFVTLVLSPPSIFPARDKNPVLKNRSKIRDKFELDITVEALLQVTIILLIRLRASEIDQNQYKISSKSRENQSKIDFYRTWL